MGLGTYVIVVLGLAVVFAWYSNRSLRGKILCTFRRANKTKIEKFISTRSKFVIFDGGKYYFNPRRVTFQWYTRGLLHSLFPTWIPTADFTWDRPLALDPETFANTWDTPEARASIQEEERFKSFAKGVQTQAGKKARFPEWLFPMIILGVLLILGYWIYQMSGQISILEQMLRVQ